MASQPIHILRQLKRVLEVILILAVVGEIILFPTLPNFYGCVMAVIGYWVFSFFLKEKYIRQFPFTFFIYLSMFMYRFLPLVATLAEGKPITFGFERPYETFLYEIILFLFSSLAFYLACEKPLRNPKNNIIQKALYQFHFFQITPAILWGMGLLGLLTRLYNFGAGDVEYGDVGGKFLEGLTYLMYAPICLIFPSLLGLKYSDKKSVWVYVSCIFIINIASNSRQSIITPIATIVLLFFVYVILNNIKLTKYFSPAKWVFMGLILVFVLNLLTNVSLAMLHTRKVRTDLDKLELFEKTIETVQDETLMNRLKIAKDKADENQFITYIQGWTEQYVDNFMLARYANMRITDETLYYAEKKGYANRQMQEVFKQNLWALLPTPVMRFFGVYLDKNKLEFSRGDLLYGSGFGGYRVTSHVGDGLATFGYWYFPIQFIVSFIVFKLVNSLVYYTRSGVLYSPYAVMGVFGFLGMFRNANGVTGDLGYIIRGFLQDIITYLIIYHLVRMLLRFINPKYVTIPKFQS